MKHLVSITLSSYHPGTWSTQWFVANLQHPTLGCSRKIGSIIHDTFIVVRSSSFMNYASEQEKNLEPSLAMASPRTASACCISIHMAMKTVRTSKELVYRMKLRDGCHAIVASAVFRWHRNRDKMAL